MSFTDQKPHHATDADCKAAWCGGSHGMYFRCALCGYKFITGDQYRFVFNTAIGNILVCAACDSVEQDDKEIANAIVYARAENMKADWADIKQRFWKFLKRYQAECEQEYQNERGRAERRSR